jgi:hypothetical protein
VSCSCDQVYMFRLLNTTCSDVCLTLESVSQISRRMNILNMTLYVIATLLGIAIDLHFDIIR